MQYQISCLSPKGYASDFANALQELLPSDSGLVSLDQEPSTDAQIHLVGFEFGSTNLDAIPYEVIDFLEELNGKVIFLFAAVPFQVDDLINRHIHNRLIQYLPRDCDYRGLYLFPSQPPQNLLKQLSLRCQEDPQNTRARTWLSRCENAKGCPNSRDFQRGCKFASHVLELERES